MENIINVAHSISSFTAVACIFIKVQFPSRRVIIVFIILFYILQIPLTNFEIINDETIMYNQLYRVSEKDISLELMKIPNSVVFYTTHRERITYSN